MYSFQKKYITSALKVNFSGIGFDSVKLSREFLLNECNKTDRSWYMFAYVLDCLNDDERLHIENFEAHSSIILEILNISVCEYERNFKIDLINKMSEVYYNNLNKFHN